MVVVGDIYANEPIFAGLVGSLVAYVVVSLLTKPTPDADPGGVGCAGSTPSARQPATATRPTASV